MKPVVCACRAVISSATEEAICNDLKTAAACKAPCAWNPNSATPYCSSPTYFANVDCMSTDNSLSPFCSVPLAIVTNCNSTKSEKTCNGFGYCLYMAVGSDGACMLNYNNMPSVFQAMGKIASQAYPSAVVLPAMYSALGGCAAHNTAASCAGATLALGIEPKTGSSSGMVSDSKAPPPKNAAGSSRRGAGQLPAAAAALLAAAVLLVL